MDTSLFRVIHIFGVALIMIGLAALWGVCFKTKGPPDKSVRMPLAVVHGLGMAIVLLTGLHMLRGLPMGGWLVVKLIIWLALGGSMVLAKRKADWGVGLLVTWALLAGLAAYMALLKPF